MPTYVYACTNPDCGHQFEAVQAFTDDALTVCPVCGQRLRKVFGSVGVVFKGSGFYRNDSREKTGGSSKPSSGSNGREGKADGAKTDSGSSSTDSSGKADSSTSESSSSAGAKSDGSNSTSSKSDGAKSTSASASSKSERTSSSNGSSGSGSFSSSRADSRSSS